MDIYRKTTATHPDGKDHLMPDYEESYLGQMRKLIGKRKMIATGARAILRDQEGRILLIRRRHSNYWGMPAGSQELGESILDCVQREVKEETGLDVISATPIAIYSDPRFSIVTSYGDPYQFLVVQFLVDEWTGSLATETDETVDARFFSLDELPEDVPPHYAEALEDLRNYDGRLILK